MSTCENGKGYLRGKLCKECPLGKSGYVGKIVNIFEINGDVGRLAGEVWKKRGGGISTQEQSEGDYKKALKLLTVKVCKKVG